MKLFFWPAIDALLIHFLLLRPTAPAAPPLHRESPYSLGNFHYKPAIVVTGKSYYFGDGAGKSAGRWQQFFGSFVEQFTTGDAFRPPGGRQIIHQFLYWATAVDAIQYLFFDDYHQHLFQLLVPALGSTKKNLYSKLFYFARLRPRLLYAIGALLRALQMCTPLGRILDPSIGVGAGINLCAMLASSRWVKPLILGWVTTKWAWTWLGADRPRPKAYIPITLSIREWEERIEQKKKREQE